MSIDGTDIAILEPRPFSSSWYSYKINHAGLRYELGISIYSNNIVWANGPYKPGEKTDLMVFRDVLKQQLESEEKVIADNIYRDEKCARKGLFSGLDARFVKRVLCRHETVNGRLKQFKVMSSPFRHHFSKHSSCFWAVLNITQLVIQNERPLFPSQF